MNKAINPDRKKKDPYMVSALFFIRGENFDPDEATARLGILPFSKHKRGDLHGEMGEMIWKSGFWALETKSIVISNDVEHHIEWILDRLDNAKEEFQIIRSRQDIHIELEIIISVFRRSWNGTINFNTINRLSEMSLPLSFSISYMAYPDEEE